MARFAIGAAASCNDYGFWELIRLYMDKDGGPAALIDKVGYCLPIAETKEPWLWSFKYNNIHFTSPFAKLCLFWLIAPLAICRNLTMATCKRPIWPVKIENECSIELDDPYVCDQHNNPPLKWCTPIVDWNDMK